MSVSGWLADHHDPFLINRVLFCNHYKKIQIQSRNLLEGTFSLKIVLLKLLIDSNTKARLKYVSRSLHINSPCFVVFYCGYFLHAAHHRVDVFVAEALYLCILWWEDEASQGLSLYSSCWMVPVRDDILKHLTHKNEFSARAQWQRWAIHSPKMWEDKREENAIALSKGERAKPGSKSMFENVKTIHKKCFTGKWL